MYFLYSAALVAALVAALPFWLLQLLRSGKYRAGLAERFGRVPQRLTQSAGENCIWIHAVSVGEALAVSGLVAQLQSRLRGWRIVVSTTTLTGQKLARQKFGEENVFHLPLDFAFALRPYLRRLRPRMVVLAETEFWPNLLRLAHENGARVAVVNARISDRSFPRYRAFRGLLGRVLNHVDLFLAQSERDRQRLIEIGAGAARAHVSGNLKFDIQTPCATPLVEQLRHAFVPGAPAIVIVCGSTVDGEEELLTPALTRVLREHPGAVIIVAPRHPERFDDVARLFDGSGTRLWRRSQWSGESLSGGIFLLDTIGELASIYSLATVAFVGGSLVPRGGHNILEPAQFGKAIVVGPHTENFREIVSTFERENAVKVVAATEFAERLSQMLKDTEQLHVLGQRAAAVYQAHAGATQRTLDALETLLWMPSSIQSRYRRQVRP